jgi:hypothetical protein
MPALHDGAHDPVELDVRLVDVVDGEAGVEYQLPCHVGLGFVAFVRVDPAFGEVWLVEGPRA